MGQSNPLIVVNVHQAVDATELERMMSDLNAKVDEIKQTLAAESEQAVTLVAKVDELQAKLDVLINDTYAKTEVNAALDEIKALIPGVVPDAPAE